MRLLILVPGNDWGGAERAAAQVADEAASRGHHVVVGTSELAQVAFGLDRHVVRRIHVHPDRKWEGPRALVDIRRARADVIYSFHRWSTFLAGVVRHSGGPPVLHHAQTMVGRRWGTWWGDRTVAVSEGMRQHVLRCGARAERTIVVRNGALPRDLPVERRTVDVVTAGRLVPGKGIDRLLEAFTMLPGATLLVLGDGPERSRLEGLAGTLGIDHRVQFRGWVADPWETYGEAAVGVVPTDTYPEGLPLTAAEMMMAGLPIVVTDVPGLREVGEGSCALVVPPGRPDALAGGLRALLEADQNGLRQAARARALRNFNAQVAAQQVVDELETIRR